MPTIAVDFDGTLSFGHYPNLGIPNIQLIDYLKERKKEGYKLILWTCRVGKTLEDAIKYCEEYGLEFDAINANIQENIDHYCDARKVLADYYIDDKNVLVTGRCHDDVSDGCHTFGELYEHRTKLFATICNTYKDISWKAKLHEDGSMYYGMFIVGIETSEGQATYHCEKQYWDLFKIKEYEHAPHWDGHTSEEAINRILSLKNK